MQKVVSISLNGIAYQLEEPGYDRLRATWSAPKRASRTAPIAPRS